MLTAGELAVFFKASASVMRRELTHVTTEYLDDVKQDARALIGQELPIWPPLADSTIKEKSSLGYTGQVSATDPLLRTGDMRESIRSNAGETIGGAEGSVGSDDKTAVYQEMGTARIPPRPFLGVALMRAEKKAEELFGHAATALLNPPIR